MEIYWYKMTAEDKKSVRVRNRRVHLANERTFLAWMRTSLGIMAFGFVVEKFALFIRQVSSLLGKSGLAEPHAALPPFGYSSLLGIVLVGLGALMAVLALVRFKEVDRQIDADTYHPTSILDALLAISILAVGIFLMLYLIHSI
ncbi:MAG: DUF202 domain-containing protein [Desulfobacterales bacterium]